jgi:GNAT superfamily N-acetyltransferase
VRAATPEDLPALVALLDELRTSGGGSRPFVRETVAVRERLVDLLGADTHAVLVADLDGDVVGMAVLSEAPLTALVDVPTLRVDYGVVARRARRQGVGRALVAAAVARAEERGMDQIAVTVVPSDRETNRFYARLGFAPVVVRRSTPVAALRRRLAGAEHRPVVDDVTRRRLLRRAPGRRALPGSAGRS